MKIGICYFSGTGNTEAVCKLFEREFTASGHEVEVMRIEDALKGNANFDVRRYDLIGIGNPVYGFSSPGLVYRFIEQLPVTNTRRVFIFKTAASVEAINNGASKRAIALLERRGYQVFYETLLCMGSNWLIKYDDRLTKQLYAAAARKVPKRAAEILAGKTSLIPCGLLTKIWAVAVGFMEDEIGAKLWGKTLRATSDCVKCNLCVNNCPCGNIRNEGGRIAFGWKCSMCMRCVYACPKHAITSRFFRPIIVRGGYDIRAIINNPAIEGDFVTPGETGAHQRFAEYIFQE